MPPVSYTHLDVYKRQMLGTALSEEKRNAFLEAFARFPNYRIIWKWEADTYFPGQAENIKFVKWIPQQDLLGNIQNLCSTLNIFIPVLMDLTLLAYIFIFLIMKYNYKPEKYNM